MGDVLSLIEKAEAVVDQKNAEQLARKSQKNAFTLEDFLDQIQQIKKIGSLKVATRLPEEGQKGLVRQYLDHGSTVTERLTQAIFQARPELHNWAFGQCSSYAAVARLAKIKRLSSEQIGRLEPGA